MNKNTNTLNREFQWRQGEKKRRKERMNKLRTALIKYMYDMLTVYTSKTFKSQQTACCFLKKAGKISFFFVWTIFLLNYPIIDGFKRRFDK